MPTNVWQPGVSGNPAGRLRGSRNRLSEAVICALLRDFSMHGEKAIAKVRRTHPVAYLKILALLVPREHKVEHSNPIKDMTTEQIERSIEFIKEMIAKRDAAAKAKEIEGEADVVPSLPAPGSGGTKMPKALRPAGHGGRRPGSWSRRDARSGHACGRRRGDRMKRPQLGATIMGVASEKKLEAYACELEQKLEARTRELAEALEQQ